MSPSRRGPPLARCAAERVRAGCGRRAPPSRDQPTRHCAPSAFDPCGRPRNRRSWGRSRARRMTPAELDALIANRTLLGAPARPGLRLQPSLGYGLAGRVLTNVERRAVPVVHTPAPSSNRSAWTARLSTPLSGEARLRKQPYRVPDDGPVVAQRPLNGRRNGRDGRPGDDGAGLRALAFLGGAWPRAAESIRARCAGRACELGLWHAPRRPDQQPTADCDRACFDGLMNSLDPKLRPPAPPLERDRPGYVHRLVMLLDRGWESSRSPTRPTRRCRASPGASAKCCLDAAPAPSSRDTVQPLYCRRGDRCRPCHGPHRRSPRRCSRSTSCSVAGAISRCRACRPQGDTRRGPARGDRYSHATRREVHWPAASRQGSVILSPDAVPEHIQKLTLTRQAGAGNSRRPWSGRGRRRVATKAASAKG